MGLPAAGSVMCLAPARAALVVAGECPPLAPVPVAMGRAQQRTMPCQAPWCRHTVSHHHHVCCALFLPQPLASSNVGLPAETAASSAVGTMRPRTLRRRLRMCWTCTSESPARSWTSPANPWPSGRRQPPPRRAGVPPRATIRAPRSRIAGCGPRTPAAGSGEARAWSSGRGCSMPEWVWNP